MHKQAFLQDIHMPCAAPLSTAYQTHLRAQAKVHLLSDGVRKKASVMLDCASYVLFSTRVFHYHGMKSPRPAFLPTTFGLFK